MAFTCQIRRTTVVKFVVPFISDALDDSTAAGPAGGSRFRPGPGRTRAASQAVSAHGSASGPGPDDLAAGRARSVHGAFPRVHDLQDLSDLLQAQVEGLGLIDELEPLDIGRAVEPGLRATRTETSRAVPLRSALPGTSPVALAASESASTSRSHALIHPGEQHEEEGHRQSRDRRTGQKRPLGPEPGPEQPEPQARRESADAHRQLVATHRLTHPAVGGEPGDERLLRALAAQRPAESEASAGKCQQRRHSHRRKTALGPGARRTSRLVPSSQRGARRGGGKPSVRLAERIATPARWPEPRFVPDHTFTPSDVCLRESSPPVGG